VVDVPEAAPGSGEATYATAQAARALGISSSRVRKMIASGELASHRDQQGRHRIPHDALRAKLKEWGFALPAGAATERPGEPEEDRQHGAWAEVGLQQELEAARREVRQLREEVHTLRGDLMPLVERVRSEQEDNEGGALQERDVFQEERAQLLAEVERERRRADELAWEMEASRQRWWARWLESKAREGRGV
jgi:excisionase family DNA binding protein